MRQGHVASPTALQPLDAPVGWCYKDFVDSGGFHEEVLYDSTLSYLPSRDA